jgi:hypothetical protein
MKHKAHYPKGLKPVQISKEDKKEVIKNVQRVLVGPRKRK